jgi:hypothetical protein
MDKNSPTFLLRTIKILHNLVDIRDFLTWQDYAQVIFEEGDV